MKTTNPQCPDTANPRLRLRSRLALVSVTSAVCLVASGCASHRLTLQPVGPAPASAASRTGSLVVYTATEEHNSGDIRYHPHSGYQIRETDGKRLQWVRNHIGRTDEMPSLVRLPPGQYYIEARAQGFGLVTVPVVIEADRLIEVRLDARGCGELASADSNWVVRLPDGTVVGWRATAERQRAE